jgi:hypothetical protein
MRNWVEAKPNVMTLAAKGTITALRFDAQGRLISASGAWFDLCRLRLLVAARISLALCACIL